MPHCSRLEDIRRLQEHHLSAGAINVVLIQPAGRQMVFPAADQQVERYEKSSGDAKRSKAEK